MDQTPNQTPFQRAIAVCGSPAELARRVGVTAQAVNHWRLHGIPTGRALKVSEITGIPVEQILAEAADEPTAQTPQALPARHATIAAAVMSTGEREFLRGPLSATCSYRLLTSGTIGSKELGKLIRVLTLQKELLDDDDTDAELVAEDNLPPER